MKKDAENAFSFPNSIWDCTCLFNSIALLALLLFALPAHAVSPHPDLWPLTLKASQSAEPAKQRATLEAAAVPDELKPAVRFQQTFLKILASSVSKAQPLEPDWVKELQAFIAADREGDPVVHGVAEVARAWIARVQMQTIDTELRQYYRKQVHFPATFSEIEPGLPDALRRDPWGQPWVYAPHAPQGLGKLSAQRYRLGPARHPDLGPLGEATGDRNSPPPSWQLTALNLGGKRVLKIRTPTGTATLEPGGKTGAFTLLFTGDNWALMAGPDQLFAVTF